MELISSFWFVILFASSVTVGQFINMLYFTIFSDNVIRSQIVEVKIDFAVMILLHNW